MSAHNRDRRNGHPSQIEMAMAAQAAHSQPQSMVLATPISVSESLFTTDATGLWEAYIKGLPGESCYGECNCGADRTGPSAEAHDPKLKVKGGAGVQEYLLKRG